VAEVEVVYQVGDGGGGDGGIPGEMVLLVLIYIL
jgi:hypothetical protein